MDQFLARDKSGLFIAAVLFFASVVPLDRFGCFRFVSMLFGLGSMFVSFVPENRTVFVAAFAGFAELSTGILHPVGSFPSLSGRSPPCVIPDSRAVLASSSRGAGGKVIAGFNEAGGFCFGGLEPPETQGSHTSSPSMLLSVLPP